MLTLVFRVAFRAGIASARDSADVASSQEGMGSYSCTLSVHFFCGLVFWYTSFAFVFGSWLSSTFRLRVAGLGLDGLQQLPSLMPCRGWPRLAISFSSPSARG